MESCILSYSLSYSLCSLQHRGFSEGSIKSFHTFVILMVFGLFFQTLRHVSSSESDVRNPKLEVAQALAVQADAKAKAVTTTCLAAWLGREASIPGSPTPPVGDLRIPHGIWKSPDLFVECLLRWRGISLRHNDHGQAFQVRRAA